MNQLRIHIIYNQKIIYLKEDLKNDDEIKLSDQEEDELESPVSGGRSLAEINGKPSLNDDASNSQDQNTKTNDLRVAKVVDFTFDGDSRDTIGHGTFISSVVGSVN